jgi:hypothetical protein
LDRRGSGAAHFVGDRLLYLSVVGCLAFIVVYPLRERNCLVASGSATSLYRVRRGQFVQIVRGKLGKLAINLLGITLPALILTAVASEGIFRALLFSKVGFMEKFRKPELYFDYDSESNYWKLYYLFGGKLKPPPNPHPLLGWGGDFSRETYLHNQASHIKGRKAVLLYGDSFAGCLTSKEECFQGILNADDEFAARCYFLNYGVGNYGVDQIFLLLKNSLDHFQNPFVIASVLTQDIDRSTLSVRIGQKPYFELVDGELVLQGIPINSDPKDFFVKNSPTIPSYLFRLWVQGNGWPQQIRQYFKGVDRIRNRRIKINEKLFLNMIYELRKRHLQHVFVVFHLDHAVQNPDWIDWQNDLIERVLRDNHEPYISTKEIVRQHLREHNGTMDDYYIKGDGHPTALQNKILADVMKKVVLDAIRDE